MKIIMEIRPAEGGDDAKLLVQDQASIYKKYASKNGIKVTVKGQDYL